MNPRIESLRSQGDLRECEELQRRIWGMEDREVVPHHILTGIQKHGGLLLGAYEGDDMVGFLFGFDGEHRGKRCHYSHMCGVVNERRFSGVGYELKLRQREFAISKGLKLVTWTFDPLEGANAYLNFHKLGVVSEIYIPNYYGEIRDALNKGVDTDRLLVEWWIESPRVAKKLEKGPPTEDEEDLVAPVVNSTEYGSGRVLKTTAYDLDLEAPALLLEIPESIQEVKGKSMELARNWRSVTGTLFQSYLRRGYVVADFLSKREEGRRRNFYILRRAEKSEVLES